MNKDWIIKLKQSLYRREKAYFKVNIFIPF